MNEPAFLPSHRHLATPPYSHKNHILLQGFEHAFPPHMPHANKYPTLTTKPTPSSRLYLRQKQPQWASPRLPIAPLSGNPTGRIQVSDPAPSSAPNSPPLYNLLPQYEREPGHRQYEQESRHLLPPQRPSSATSSITYLQTAAAEVIATAHQTHFQHPPLSPPPRQGRFFAKPHSFHFGDSDDGPVEDAFSRGNRQGEPEEEEDEQAMERYRDDVERQTTFVPTYSSASGASSFPRGVSGMRDSPHFRPMAQHNVMHQRPRPQQEKQPHKHQRQQYDVSDLGHDLVHSASTLEHRRGLGGHVGSYFQEQQQNNHNNSPSPPPQHIDQHDFIRPWLPLGLQDQRDLGHPNRHMDIEDECLHPQPVRSIAQHLYECQDQEGHVIGQYYSTWAHSRDQAREWIFHSQDTLQDDDFWHQGATNHSGLHPSQGAQLQLTSSRQYQDEEELEQEEEEELEMGLDDPASAHQSCIETLSQLEQDLAEMQSRYNVLQQECDNLRRSNEQMVMDHVQEIQALQQEHRQALDELRKRARTYHEEAIQRRKDKESKRQSASHDQLRLVFESNKAFRAKVRALERGQIEAEREQRDDLVHLTGLVEQMVAQVGEITSTTTTTTTATATQMSEQDAVAPRKQGMEQTKTPSGTSPTLVLSPQEIPPQAGKEEDALSLKSLHAQKCHTTLLQLQTLMDQLPKVSAAPKTETLKGHGVDFDVDEAQKQRRRTKRQSGSSASSGETLAVSMATTRRKHTKEEQEHEHEPSTLARKLLLEQQYRHQVEIEQIKQQCVALYRASLAEVRAEMKNKLAKTKKTSVPSFGH